MERGSEPDKRMGENIPHGGTASARAPGQKCAGVCEGH